ncbi:nucleoside deaminase [Streptomyces sparsogenes]|uniref:nucleoside deaminase n=1 Tax=Streptomyces sparsogenes TaxID=67365 RepID=UPI0033F31936
MVSDADLGHLRRCVELATEALEAGDEPFGSVLVAADGTVLFEDHNHVASGDHTRHPEFEIARWAAAHLSPGERAAATVYTSGEHCPMCAAAHGWVGLGRIVYASSSEQLGAWLGDLGVPAPPVRTLPIREVLPGAVVEGPVPDLAERIRELHRRFHDSARSS